MDSYQPSLKILLTGFGSYRQFTNNPSNLILKLLPKTLTHRGLTLNLVIPSEPMKSEYNHILTTIPTLIQQHQPDVIISIGQDELAKDFKIERGAKRDVYFECPDNARKTLTKKETSKLWSECEERLESENVDFEKVLGRWKEIYYAKEEEGKKGGKQRDVAVAGVGISEDAGNFVCGFLYYAVLAELKRRREENERRVEKAVFLHVPPLRTEGELKVGAKVVEALIKAMVEGYEV